MDSFASAVVARSGKQSDVRILAVEKQRLRVQNFVNQVKSAHLWKFWRRAPG